MTYQERTQDRIAIQDGDISDSQAARLSESPAIAWDIETTGLDWRAEKIALCQIYSEELGVAVVRINERRPSNLAALLEADSPRKVFHHAMFDLRFMASHWSATPSNIACTKIASKILRPRELEHSLSRLVSERFAVTLRKELRSSNWLTHSLSDRQIDYAVNDVIYLLRLFEELKRELVQNHLWALASRAFDHIPTRVDLDLLGYDDIYQY